MIFLDNASTTKPDDETVKNFVEYQKYFFNPGANYSPSIFLSEKIEQIRHKISKLLGGNESDSFIFTASSTIANNIIINSVVTNNKNEEYVFSSLEHPSVFNIATKLMLEGKKVIFIPSTSDGFIDTESLYNCINSNTKFVSIINVSNETGAINDIAEIAKKIKQLNPKTLIHSDGVQALGKIKVDVSNLDFYTISSHKIYGLKGVAGFYVKNIKNLKPFILGGGQEFNISSGTTNVPMIFSFYDCIENAVKNQEENFERVLKLNNILRKKVSEIENIEINSPSNEGDIVCCSPYVLSLSVLGLNAETIQNMLSEKNIYVGLGSACSAKKSGNRILESMHKNKSEILGNLRISLSKNTTKEEILIFCKELEACIKQLRGNL